MVDAVTAHHRPRLLSIPTLGRNPRHLWRPIRPRHDVLSVPALGRNPRHLWRIFRPWDNTDGNQFAHAAIIVDTDVGAKPTPFMANISPVGYTHGDQFAHAMMYCRCHRRGETHAIYGDYFARGTTPMATNSPTPRLLSIPSLGRNPRHLWRIFRPWDTPPMANISPEAYTTDGDQFAHATIIVGADVGAKPTPFMANISPVGYTHGDQFAHAMMYCRCHRRGETHAIYGDYFARGTTPMATNSPTPRLLSIPSLGRNPRHLWRIFRPWDTPPMANISPVGQRRWRPIRPWCPRHDHRRRGATRTAFMPAPAPSGHTCFHKKGDICYPTPPPNSPR